MGKCKEVQTKEIEVDSLYAQTEVSESKEVQMKEPDMTTSEVQTECSVDSSHLQMEQVTHEKGSQSEPTDSDTKSIQTENQGQEKENQTEIKNNDKQIQTEVKFDDRGNEMDINSSNIITVNHIEVVQEMLSWGTQTDLDELDSMEPIFPSQIITDDDIDGNKHKEICQTLNLFFHQHQKWKNMAVTQDLGMKK